MFLLPVKQKSLPKFINRSCFACLTPDAPQDLSKGPSCCCVLAFLNLGVLPASSDGGWEQGLRFVPVLLGSRKTQICPDVLQQHFHFTGVPGGGQGSPDHQVFCGGWWGSCRVLGARAEPRATCVQLGSNWHPPLPEPVGSS